MAEFDFEIDALTNSVILARTGRSLQTRIVDWRDMADFQRELTRKWRFNWFAEAAYSSRRIAGLLVAHSEEIEGLVSFEPRDDHVYAHLIESAPHNISQVKVYEGVPGNLMAYVCRESGRLGFDGAVAFDSKSVLVNHYKKTLGARQAGKSNRMYLHEDAAAKLVERYFKDGDEWA